VLDGHLLKYYKGSGADGTSVDTTGELKGVIALQGCQVTTCEPKEADGKQCCFKITPASRKVYIIKAPDVDTRDSWIEAVRVNAGLQMTGGEGGASSSIDLMGEADRAQTKNAVEGGDENVTLGDFELLKVIGRGTYGKVMQVRRRDTGEVYAMKVLKKASIVQKAKTTEHIKTERQVLAAVRQAPFLVTLYYAFQTDAKLHLILEYIRGGELFTHLFKRVKICLFYFKTTHWILYIFYFFYTDICNN
jgi:hypothetical protein